MNEDRANETPRLSSQIELAAYLSFVALLALVIGLSFESAARQSLPGAIASLLLVPLMLSFAFRRINVWTPSKRLILLGNLCLASIALSAVLPFLAYLFSSPPSHGATPIITNVLAWITIALLSLYTLALVVTLFVAFINRLQRNAADSQTNA
jgi:hypothetical protein